MKEEREAKRAQLDGRHDYILSIVASCLGLEKADVEDAILEGNQVPCIHTFSHRSVCFLCEKQNKTAASLTLAKGVEAFELHHELLFLLAQNCCHIYVILLISVFLGEEVVGVMYFGQGKRIKCSLVIVI